MGLKDVKRLSFEYKSYLLLRAKKIQQKQKKKSHGQKACLSTPFALTLEDNYDETVEFLTKLSEVYQYKIPRRIDFSRLKTVSPAATLMLASVIDSRKKQFRTRVKVYDFHKWNYDIKVKFMQMGLFELLGINNFSKNFKRRVSLMKEDIIFIKFRSSTKVKGELAAILNDEIMQITKEIPNVTMLHASLTEAMQNAVEHAYTDDMVEEERLWWIAGSYKKSSRKLIVIAYDRGIGIPVTLPQTHNTKLQKFISLFSLKDTDADRIEVAVTKDTTSTGKKERGKGLPEMKDYIKNSNNGKLKIFSNKGFYIYEVEDGKELEIKKNNSNIPIQGTLIQWEVKL